MPKKSAKAHGPEQSRGKKYRHYFLHYLSCLAIVLVLTLTTLNLNKFMNSKKVLGAQTDNSKILDEKTYWLEVTKNNPTYLGAYLELAKVDTELGLTDEARIYIQTAYKLQPNSLTIPEVQKLLGL